MQHVVAFWLSIPPEARGWLEFWSFCALVTGFRWAIVRWAKPSAAKHWAHAFDVLLQIATASSPRVAAWRRRLDHGGIPDVLLPRVSLPPIEDERTPVERPSKRP